MSIPQLKNPKKLSYNELREQVSELARRMNILTDMRAVSISPTGTPKFNFSDDSATLDVPSLEELTEELTEDCEELEEELAEAKRKIEELEALLDGTASGCASSSDSTSLGTINWIWCASIDESTNKIVGEITWGSVGVPAPVCNQSSAANYTFRVNFYTEANAYIGEAGQFSNGTISEAMWPCDGGPFETDGISSGGSSMVLNKVVPAAAYFVGMENLRIRIKPSPNGP